MLEAVINPDTLDRYPIRVYGPAMAAGAVASSLVLAFVVGRVIPIGTRRRHNLITGSIFSIVGVTYAVLLAFVAMLAWGNYDAAQVATNREAALLFDAARTATGLADPARAEARADLVAYAEIVLDVEWPAQADGRQSRAGEPSLDFADAIIPD